MKTKENLDNTKIQTNKSNFAVENSINQNKNCSNKKINFFVKLWNYFSTYEKIWFTSILVLSIIFAFVFPEEDANGVNGKIIMILYLADIFLNILCELLISKQSKWNFIVSLFVEVTEIVTLIILSARFASMVTTLFFWIPIDIISFINWNRHKDSTDAELTIVRKLKTWQLVLIMFFIVIWTVGIGYLVAAYAPETDFFSSDKIEKMVCYLDACASAVGLLNGLFIWLRYKEQWIAWYICTFLEIAINILCGQWVLLVLKAGYLTNTTYGYVKWTKYINQHSSNPKHCRYDVIG